MIAAKNQISIIIPIYNIREQYLRECIGSIQEQTMQNIEIILINDGSTNNSGIICEEYAEKDQRIKVIHQNNKGVSAARNRGIDEASSEWIIFIDPDDWVETNMCENVYKCIAKNNTDILIFTFVLNSSDKEIPHYYGDIEEFEFKSSDHELLQLSIMNSYSGFNPLVVGSIWAKVFKKDFLNKNKIRFLEDLPKTQDLIFCLYALEGAEKITYLNQAFYHYRMNEDSICHKYNPNIYEYVSRVIKESQRFVNDYNKNDQFEEAQYNMILKLFSENMHLDFFSINNLNTYLYKRKKFISILGSDPYKTALMNIKFFQYTTKGKIKMMLIKYKWFLPLYLWYRMREEKIS